MSFFGFLARVFQSRPRRRRRPQPVVTFSECSIERPCNMRKKIALTPTVFTEASCGVADVELADFMVFDKVTSTGKKVISFRFCPWCGKPWHWQGCTWELVTEDDEDTEDFLPKDYDE